MYRFLRSPRWILASLAVVLLIVAFILLGFWQLGRWAERRDFNHRFSARLAEPALPTESVVVAEDPARFAYRRAIIAGRYDTAREVLLVSRSHRGQAGHHVLTPLITARGDAVLVNRGWVPLEMNVAPVRDAAPPETVTVSGVHFPTQQRGLFGPKHPPAGTLRTLFRVDIPRMRAQLPYAVSPLFLQLESQQPPQWQRFPIPAPIPRPEEGPHRSYAIQWFAFALAAAATYGALVRKTARGAKQSMLEFTDWAKDILRKADEAARRLNPAARVRLARAPGGMHALLAEEPEPEDATVDVDGTSLFIASGIEGLVDIEEPHDRLVLRPAGSTPNVREPH